MAVKIDEAIALKAADIAVGDTGKSIEGVLIEHADIIADLGSRAASGIPTKKPGVSVQEALDTTQQNLASSAKYLSIAIQIANRIYDGEDLTERMASEILIYDGNVWAWIQARIKAAYFDGIYVSDYIPFVAPNGYTIKAEVAGIDTYYNYGNPVTSHHIDFISRDCWTGTRQFNKASYNNGTTVSPHPWLASDLYAWLNSLSMSVPNTATANPRLVAVNYSTTGVYDKLPTTLKAVIAEKYVRLPSRYTAGSLLTADNSWAWVSVGNLWIPSEVEVSGREDRGSKNGYSGGAYQQYPIFAQNMKRIKGNGDGGSRISWWLLSACGMDSVSFGAVVNHGDMSIGNSGTAACAAPICFRIA